MLIENPQIWIFLLLLPTVSFFYASVGHGGASGYLALMALFSFSPEVMKPTALLLNLFVAAVAFYFYYKEGYFNKKLFFYFAISSIPASFIGGMITIETNLYKKILAILLFLVVIKMIQGISFGKLRKKNTELKKIKIITALIVGAFIGFFSGLIGIGGGVILTPIILLLNWGKIKEAAAVSALFIWVNSASGLAGQFTNGLILEKETFILVSFALLGGFLGAFYGSKKLNNIRLKFILALVLVVASVKLFFV